MKENYIKILKAIEKKPLSMEKISEVSGVSYQMVSRYSRTLRICNYIIVECNKGISENILKISAKGKKAINSLNSELLELINL